MTLTDKEVQRLNGEAYCGSREASLVAHFMRVPVPLIMDGTTAEHVEVGKTFCSACTVVDLCQQRARDIKGHGVWGGVLVERGVPSTRSHLPTALPRNKELVDA